MADALGEEGTMEYISNEFIPEANATSRDRTVATGTDDDVFQARVMELDRQFHEENPELLRKKLSVVDMKAMMNGGKDADEDEDNDNDNTKDISSAKDDEDVYEDDDDYFDEMGEYEEREIKGMHSLLS